MAKTKPKPRRSSRSRRPRVGAFIRVWWNTGVPGNWARILAIHKYTGMFPEYFDCVLDLPAVNTRKGWLQMAYHSSEYIRDSRK